MSDTGIFIFGFAVFAACLTATMIVAIGTSRTPPQEGTADPSGIQSVGQRD